jgi:hypothetical protein
MRFEWVLDVILLTVFLLVIRCTVGAQRHGSTGCSPGSWG